MFPLAFLADRHPIPLSFLLKKIRQLRKNTMENMHIQYKSHYSVNDRLYIDNLAP